MSPFTDDTIYLCQSCLAELMADEVIRYRKEWYCPHCRGANIKPLK